MSNEGFKNPLASARGAVNEELNGGCLDEREAFEARYKHLTLTRDLAAWGGPRYVCQPVQDLWEGWQARASLSTSKQAGGEPVTDEQIAQWAERHDVHGSVGELRAMVGDARTLENADVATPPAAIPAAPSEVTDAQIERMTNLAFAATNDRGEMGLQKYWYGKGVREGASLTQPTTVQQAGQGESK